MGEPVVPRLCAILPQATEREKDGLIRLLRWYPRRDVEAAFEGIFRADRGDIRREAVLYLGQWQDRAVEEDVLAMAQAQQPEDRAAAVEAAGYYGDRRSFGTVCGAMIDRAAVVRLAAVKALARFPGYAPGPRIVGLLGDRDGEVRLAAYVSLARVDPQNANIRWDTNEIGTELITSKNELEVESCALALASAGVPASSKYLAQVLRGSSDDAAYAVLDDMRRSSVPLAWADLKPCFTRPWAARYAAMEIAGRRRMLAALPMLVKMLSSGSWGDRHAAADALRRLSTKEAVPTLKKLLGDDTLEIRTLAAEGLVRLGIDDPRISAVRNAVEAESRNPDYDRREQAAKACRRFGDSWAKRLLGRLAQDPVVFVRYAAEHDPDE
jgi:hypothetical protein